MGLFMMLLVLVIAWTPTMVCFFLMQREYKRKSAQNANAQPETKKPITWISSSEMEDILHMHVSSPLYRKIALMTGNLDPAGAINWIVEQYNNGNIDFQKGDLKQ